MRISMAISLLETIKNGDQETAKRILQQKQCSNLDKQSPRRDGTALYWSCCQGFLDVVNLLLLRGADANLTTNWGASSVHACVDHNRVDILALLIEFGANVNKQTGNGDTPCHLAAYRGYGSCVQLLAERGANVLIRNNKRKTALQEAESSGHYEISRYLQAVENLSHGTSLDERSMSIPYMSVAAVDPYREATVRHPQPLQQLNTCSSVKYVTSQTRDAQSGPYQSHNNFYRSHGIPQSIHQSTNGMHFDYLTSQKTSYLSDQSENSGCYSSFGQSSSGCDEQTSLSSVSSSSMGSIGYDMSIESVNCDSKRNIMGILRLSSVNSEQDSRLNNLSSVETSSEVAPPGSSTKPTLTFRNI